MTFEDITYKQETLTMPEILAVTDLGKNNKGTISAADVDSVALQSLINDLARPEYRKKPTNRFRCVDGRLPEGGLQPESDEADPQGAGGEPVFEPIIDFMIETENDEKLSSKVVRHTKRAKGHGRPVVMHGDNRKGKGGCGANAKKREVLLMNAENADIIAPKAWSVSEAAGISHLLVQDDVIKLILTGKENAERDELWDITPEQHVDIAVENGAEYEELIEEHAEKVINVDVSEYAFDEESYMRDHPNPNKPGSSYEAFVASVGVYKKIAFEDAAKEGKTDRDAALRVLGFILFNIGVPKELTAEEQGNGEALPVVIVK
jgi:hypothetical protein